jgi:hypothetical protein
MPLSDTKRVLLLGDNDTRGVVDLSSQAGLGQLWESLPISQNVTEASEAAKQDSEKSGSQLTQLHGKILEGNTAQLLNQKEQLAKASSLNAVDSAQDHILTLIARAHLMAVGLAAGTLTYELKVAIATAIKTYATTVWTFTSFDRASSSCGTG